MFEKIAKRIWGERIVERVIERVVEERKPSIEVLPSCSIEASQRLFATVKNPAKLLARVGGSELANGFAFDSAETKMNVSAFDSFEPVTFSENVSNWYGSQSYIGPQLCAVLAQQWLINKACSIAAEDATRHGYELTRNDGQTLDSETSDKIRQSDKRLKITQNLLEFERFAQVFGIRIALFLVDSEDEKYYEKPFNIDGVKPGTYKGISQVDPYWCNAELDASAVSDPINKDFYEPTYWRIGALKVHKSHLIISVPKPVPDILKPTYRFGGIPLTQEIYERVYNAEVCANEGPKLLMTKRTKVMQCDIEAVIANQSAFEKRLQTIVSLRDNHGIQVLGEGESVSQLESSLSDLDTTILTQYELVAAIARIPASKLLGQAPAGSLATTGDYEMTTYHEMLESIQSLRLTPLLDRHYQILLKSDFPEIANVNLTVTWNGVKSVSDRERAELNTMKAQTDATLAQVGAIDGQMIRERVIKDPFSGYSGHEEKKEDFSDLEAALKEVQGGGA